MKIRWWMMGIFSVMLAGIMVSCMPGRNRNNVQPEFYTMEDFRSVEKIDAHIHINEGPSWLEKAQEDKFRVLTLNTSVRQRQRAVHQMESFPGTLAFATTFSLEGWGEPGWQENTIAYLEESIALGAVAVKVWKNIGMSFQDQEGQFVQIDDPRFDPVFQFLSRQGIPLVGHIGDPRNCWLPLEEMTVETDRRYFSSNPRFHMYLHPEYPSHEEIMDARDHLLEKHPGLTFIGAHLGSLEWDVDEMARRFDRYPNFAVDMAERVCHLQLQSSIDREKVRDFMIRYADRLIYGSDFGSGISKGGEPDSVLAARMHHLWVEAWRYFATDAVMSAPEFEGSFRGLKLPAEVVDKIFRENAQNWIPGMASMAGLKEN